MSRCRMLAETLLIHDLMVIPYRKALRFIFKLKHQWRSGFVCKSVHFLFGHLNSCLEK